jgi:hypothetical protein
MIVAMIVDMINAHLMRCNVVNPFLTGAASQYPMAWWADRVTKRFWGESDPEAAGKGSAVVFAVACTVASVAGYLVQQFLVGTGIALAFSKTSAFSKLADVMQGAKKALKEAAGKARDVGAMVKKGVRGAAEAATDALKATGAKLRDGLERLWRWVARHGCSNCGLEILEELGQSGLDDILARAARRIEKGVADFLEERQWYSLQRHSPHVAAAKGMDKGSLFPRSWSNKKILDAIEEAADTGVYKGLRQGAEIWEKTIDGVLVRAKKGAVGIIDGHPVYKP